MDILVYGLGAIGSNFLLQLSRQYPQFHYTGVDFDKVESRNIPIQAYFKEHVNLPKAKAMQIILQRYSTAKYTPVLERVIRPLAPIKDKSWLVIDCFDNTASRGLIRGSERILHIGFSPAYTAECIWDENYDVPGDVDEKQGDICQMQEAIGFIHFVVNRAVLTVSKYLNENIKENWIVTGKTKLTYL
jgi:hypothetical protein